MDDRSALALASDPTTAPTVLKSLADEYAGNVREIDREIVSAVAMNPNASFELLDRLAQGYPDSLAANPLFEIEPITLFKAFGHSARAAIATSVPLPDALFHYILHRSSKRHSLAHNPRLRSDQALQVLLERTCVSRPQELLDRLDDHVQPFIAPLLAALDAIDQDGDDVVLTFETPWPADFARYLAAAGGRGRALLALHPDIADDEIAPLRYDPWSRVRRALASRPGARPEWIAALASDERAAVRAAAIRHRVYPVESLARLSDDRSHPVQRVLATHPGTPGNVLEQLIAQNATWLHSLLARHPNATPAVFRAIASRPSLGLKRLVAESPRAPGDVLASLCTLDDKALRLAVAENPRTPESALLRLACAPEHEIRLAVVCNPSAPQALVGALASDDPFPPVRSAALQRLVENASNGSETDRHCSDPQLRSRMALLLSEDAVAQQRFDALLVTDLAAACRDPWFLGNPEPVFAKLDDEMRSALMAQPGFPLERVWPLVTSDPIRQWALSCAESHAPAAIEPLILALRLGRGIDFRGAAMRAGSPLAELIDLLRLIDLKDRCLGRVPLRAPIALVRSYASMGIGGRALLALHPEATREEIERLSNDRDDRVRTALAARQPIDHGLACTLTNDRSEDVCATLARNGSIAPSVLDALRRHPDSTVRTATLAHPGTPVEALETAAEHGTAFEQAEAALNPHLPVTWQLRLVHTLAHQVIRSLTANDDVDASVIPAFQRLQITTGRRAAAQNPALSPRWRAALLYDDDPQVRALAARRVH